MASQGNVLMYTFDSVTITVENLVLTGFAEGAFELRFDEKTITKRIGADGISYETRPKVVTNQGSCTITMFSNNPSTKELHQLYLDYDINKGGEVINGVQLPAYLAGSAYNSANKRRTTFNLRPDTHSIATTTYGAGEPFMAFTFMASDIIDKYEG